MGNKEIYEICKEFKIENYTINSDGSIDVNGNVFLYDKGLRKLPLRFNYVKGDFICSNNELETLEGSPREVGGDFYCSYNKLTSLKGAPLKVSGNFYCSYNKLTSLKYAPLEMGGSFYCFDNSVKLDYGSYKKSIKRMNKLSKL